MFYEGKKGKVSVNASTSEVFVGEIVDWSINSSADEIDVSTLGSEWKKKAVGQKQWSGSLNGHYDPADTDGQMVLEAAYKNGSKLQDIRFYNKHSATPGDTIIYETPDTDTDPDAGVYITGWNTSVDLSGVGKLAGSFIGTGPFKTVETTVPA
jgi:predicted secreted protein